MNHLVEIATGRLLSSSILSITTAAGNEVITLPDGDERGIWNTGTKIFDTRPEQRIIDKLEFLDLFTDSELEAIIGSSNSKVRVFIKKLELAQTVDLKSARMITAVNGMETLGMIGSGRAAVILNG